ncbi:MAG: nicotinate (nicotinamide) nucleotide adenylyltransferase, partial [Actinomycetota bacterium]|nr:nicotinate (nicotinamide) nucleotide adenylyltransferase [Actinomycetota bacterium]
VMLIPVFAPPHKPLEDDPGPEHRLELCRLAAGGDERFAVSALEISRQGPSYTVDTLQELHANEPDNELFLILGGDVAAGLPRWRAPEDVVALATPAVANRRGTPRARAVAGLSQLPGGERARFFSMPWIGVSSTMIRRRITAGQPIRYLVPDAVAAYIEAKGMYR